MKLIRIDNGHKKETFRWRDVCDLTIRTEQLRALDNFTISADGEIATVAGEMKIEMVRPAHDDGDQFWLTISLPSSEELNVVIQRTDLLQQLGIEADAS